MAHEWKVGDKLLGVLRNGWGRDASSDLREWEIEKIHKTGRVKIKGFDGQYRDRSWGMFPQLSPTSGTSCRYGYFVPATPEKIAEFEAEQMAYQAQCDFNGIINEMLACRKSWNITPEIVVELRAILAKLQPKKEARDASE